MQGDPLQDDLLYRRPLTGNLLGVIYFKGSTLRELLCGIFLIAIYPV